MIDRVARVGGALPAQPQKPAAPSGESFGALLQKAQEQRQGQKQIASHRLFIHFPNAPVYSSSINFLNPELYSSLPSLKIHMAST